MYLSIPIYKTGDHNKGSQWSTIDSFIIIPQLSSLFISLVLLLYLLIILCLLVFYLENRQSWIYFFLNFQSILLFQLWFFSEIVSFQCLNQQFSLRLQAPASKLQQGFNVSICLSLLCFIKYFLWRKLSSQNLHWNM